MAQSTRPPVPSVKWFQQFAEELIALKSLPFQGAPAPTPAAAAPTAPSGGAAVDSRGSAAVAVAAPIEVNAAAACGRAAAIRQRLIAALDRQLAEALRTAGPVGVAFHQDAVYVMAGLADEIFIRLQWDEEERRYWLRNLIETHYFGSSFAGERFFQKVDRLLERNDDPAAETATVYLMALALGFRGKYYGPSGERNIADYSTRLFHFIANRDPELKESTRLLFPAAYRHTLQSGAPRRFSNPRRWWLVLLVVVAAWFVASDLLWRNMTAPLVTDLPKLENEAPPAASSANK
jgi:type VI secretion system protein ImpK